MTESFKTTLRIDAMDCPTEATMLQDALRPLPGVRALDFDLLRRRLVVTHDSDDLGPVLAAIRKLGMSAVIVARPDDHVQARGATTGVSGVRRGMSSVGPPSGAPAGRSMEGRSSRGGPSMRSAQRRIAPAMCVRVSCREPGPMSKC